MIGYFWRAGLAAAIVLVAGCANLDAGSTAASDGPRYDRDGQLLFPAEYREWVFLSSGLDMSYSDVPTTAHVFDNVFAAPAAHAAFKRTGKWPDGTVLIMEKRAGTSRGSINRSGHFQTGDVVGVEAHVKDAARFKGGWGFFIFAAGKPAARVPYSAACYSCHLANASVDTTFVQFYPTLRPIARAKGTFVDRPGHGAQ